MPLGIMAGMGDGVRRIRSGEWREYRELRLEALRDSPLAFVEQYAESARESDEFWQGRVDRAAAGTESALYVAVRDGKFVAKATAFIEPDVTDHRSAHVVGVYTAPQARGTGVSAQVIGAAIGWALDEGKAGRVRLFVLEGNDRAAALYRRLGFEASGYTMPYPPDPAHTELEMVYRSPL